MKSKLFSNEARPTRTLSRRQLLKMGALLGLGGATLAACGAPAPTAAPKADAPKAEAKPTDAPAAAAEQAEIIFWGHADHPIYLAGQAFMKKFPEIKFTHVEIGDERAAKVEAALAAGSGAPDLNWLEASDVQSFGRRNVLLNVDDVVRKYEDQIVKAKLSEAKVKGTYFGMPGDITPCTYWVRPDILEKAGVKEIAKDIKYEEFLTLAKQVKEKAGSSLFVFNSNGADQSSLLFTSPFYALGGNFTDESGDNVLMGQGDAAEKAVEFAKQAWETKAGLDAAWFSPPYWAAIKEGKLGGTYTPPWMRGFYETEVKSPADGQGKWKNNIIPVYPGGEKNRTNVWGGATLCSYTQTKYPDTVKKFMEFTFATMEGAQVTADWGIVPPYLPWLTTKLKDVKQTLFSDATWADTVNDALGMMRTDFYRNPGYGPAVGPLMDKYFMPMIKGEMPIKDGVKKWSDELVTENKKILENLK